VLAVRGVHALFATDEVSLSGLCVHFPRSLRSKAI
jgi:hypothetical protein